MRLALAGVAVVLEVAGVAMVVVHFDAHSAWLFCGLTTVLVGVFAANAAFNCTLARTLDEEFDAGHRVGYRAGRRAQLTSRPVADLTAFRQRKGDDGRVPQTPVRALAGDGPHARRPTTHAH